MGRKHSHEQILDAATRVTARTGFSGLSFRLVAEEVGTSDRMVVYYFADKGRLIGSVLERVGDLLQQMLSESLPSLSDRGASRLEVLLAARQVLTDPASEWVIRVFLEAVGLAVAHREPFVSLGPPILQAWVDWLEARMGEGAQPGSAVAVIAVLEGMLIAEALLGTEAASAGWEVVIESERRLDDRRAT
ncbi:MAG: hypothetical protein RI885_1739 [Actinomycetota bacterium]|jgi:AcrR family transcriptional regulator